MLVALAGTEMPLTGRDVVRLVDRRSPSAVAAALDRLVQHGLVRRQHAGRAYLHSLNRKHLAAHAVELLAEMRTALRDRLRNLVQGWEQASVHLSIFGSAARGDGDLGSDIDLFLVRPDDINVDDPLWRGQVRDLEIQVEDWTGNAAEIHEIDHDDLRQFVHEAPPVLRELRADAIDVCGTRLYELLKDAGG